MNNPASNTESSKPSKSIKQSHRVEAQLANLEKAKSEVVPETLTARLPEVENITASTLPPVEKVALLPVQTVKPTEIADELAAGANRKMMAKLKRAFRRAGKSEASEKEISAFLISLLESNVPVLGRSSGRISRVVKGEQSIESLLLSRVPKKSA